jgi:phage terminase large subunit GpA-like protein
MTDAEWAIETWQRGLALEPELRLAEWCDAHRVLPDTSAEPGRWRTDRVPYLREPLDSLSPGNGIEVVVVTKAAQTGGTELGLCLLSYIIAHAPGACLAVLPSLDMAKSFVLGRFDKMSAAMPCVRERIGDKGTKKTGNTMLRKQFLGGEIRFAGSNSAASLRSMPCRYVILDEVDAFEADLQGEGDPVALAEARTITFGSRKKILLISTPTHEGSRIETAYGETDQRRFQVPCPSCDAGFEMAWEHLTWPKGERHLAFMVCPQCGGVIEESSKARMLVQGQWVPTAHGDGVSRGFAIGGLMSPFVTWASLAVEHGRVKDDPARHKAFRNTKLGLSWRDDMAGTADAHSLAARAETYSPELDTKIGTITCGVDFQDRWLALQIVGWAAGEEAFSLGYHIQEGDPSQPAFWANLDGLLRQPVRLPGGRTLPILCACLDSGGRYTQRVLEFAAPRHGRGILAVKGSSRPGTPAWPRKPTHAARGGWPLYIVGVDTLKEDLLARLPKSSGAAAIHFPDHYEAHYFEELCSERPRTVYRAGKAHREWFKKDHARNEAWDTFIYAMAALSCLKMAGLNVDQEAANAAITIPETPRPKVSRSRFMDR